MELIFLFGAGSQEWKLPVVQGERKGRTTVGIDGMEHEMFI